MASPDERPRLEDDCLAGGGEMGALMRSFDWSSTPLGPVRTWPQSLKTAVRIMLHSRYAMWMAWGPALTFFCNDAYRPTLGVKARWALGSRSDKVWEEIWPDIGPRIRTVLEAPAGTIELKSAAARRAVADAAWAVVAARRRSGARSAPKAARTS